MSESAQNPAASPPEPPTLPEMTDETIDRIESRVFTSIAAERERARRRRRGAFLGIGAAAALVLVAAVAVPAVISGSTMSAGGLADSSSESAVDGALSPEMIEGDAVAGADMAVDAEESMVGEEAAREIITNASMSIIVDDVGGGTAEVAGIAETSGGWVESMNVGTSRPLPVEPYVDDTIDSQMAAPVAEYGWITVRVPADELSAVMDDVRSLGEVTDLNVGRSDVTSQAIDLRARIDAAQASVDRLTELMSQSGSIGDLIAAESALSERQAMLESYQQQLEMLESQVAMSTLTVSLSVDSVPVTADPAGFGDGFTAGWNALVALGNGLVVGLGFVLPWLVVLVVVGAIVWLIVGGVRRSRRGADPDQTT